MLVRMRVRVCGRTTPLGAWEHSRLGACHASFSSLSLVPQQRLDVAISPLLPTVCVALHPDASGGLFAVAVPFPLLLLLPVTTSNDAHHACVHLE